MRINHRITQWLASLLLLFAPVFVQAQFSYTNNGDGTATITGYAGYSGGAVTIPSTTNGLTVTAIGDYAFAGSNPYSFTIPGSVVSIGNGAFKFSSLVSITIPSGVTNIGDAAFTEDQRLSSITVDPQNANYSSVNGVLFNKSQTTLLQYPASIGGSYVIPNGVTNIGDGAFSTAFGLVGVTIPNTVTSIGNSAFAYCSGLGTIVIPDSVVSLGDSAFIYCTYLFDVTLGNGLTSIGQNAFYSCNRLGSVTFGNSLASIGSSAFGLCSLSVLSIPSSVTNIGDYAFEDCNRLALVFFAGNAPNADATVFTGESPVIYYSSGSTGWGSTFAGLPTILLPFTYAMNGSAVTVTGYTGPGGALTIPYGINAIGDGAFSGNNSLTSISIPDSVFSIGNGAFSGTGLTSISIPDGVAVIGDDAFENCAKLASVSIGIGIADIGDYAFENCSSLVSVFFTGNAPSAAGTAFDGASGATIYYLTNTQNWSSPFANRPAVLLPFTLAINSQDIIIVGYTGHGGAVTIPDGITSIGTTAFFNNASVTSIAIPSSLASIEAYAFGLNSGLTAFTVDAQNANYSSLDGVLFSKDQTELVDFPGGVGGSYAIPNGVTNIGDYAFIYASSLTNVSIPDSLTSIGTSAFLNSGLTSISIPDTVTSIGNNAFAGCTSLAGVSIGDGVTNIGIDAFGYCSSLTSIVVDPQNANFAGVDGILLNTGQATLLQFPGGAGGSCVIPNGVANIAEAAFAGATLLESVTIPNSVTNIGNNAFNGCSSLASISVGNGVTSIGDAVFEDCNLSSITLPNSVTSIGSSAFAYNYNLTSVILGNGLGSLGNHAFSGCYSLTSVFATGNAPNTDGTAFLNGVYYDVGPETLYYLSGTGWDDFANNNHIPDVLWNPVIQTGDGSFGVQNNQFGFNITGTADIPIAVQASADMTGGSWTSLQTCTLTNGSIYFSDPQWTNYPTRFYRISSP